MDTGPSSQVVETRVGRFWLGDDGIIRVVAHAGAENRLDDAKDNVAAIFKLADGKKRPVLADIRKIKLMDRESRRFYASQMADVFAASALALLVASPVSRVVASFLLGLNKLAKPTRVFASEPEAVEWLKGYLQ